MLCPYCDEPLDHGEAEQYAIGSSWLHKECAADFRAEYDLSFDPPLKVGSAEWADAIACEEADRAYDDVGN